MRCAFLGFSGYWVTAAINCRQMLILFMINMCLPERLRKNLRITVQFLICNVNSKEMDVNLLFSVLGFVGGLLCRIYFIGFEGIWKPKTWNFEIYRQQLDENGGVEVWCIHSFCYGRRVSDKVIKSLAWKGLDRKTVELHSTYSFY